MANRCFVVARCPSILNLESLRLNIIDNGDGTVSLYVQDEAQPTYPANVTATGYPVVAPGGTGSVTGNGTTGALTKWLNGPASALEDSLLFDDGSVVGIGGLSAADPGFRAALGPAIEFVTADGGDFINVRAKSFESSDFTPNAFLFSNNDVIASTAAAEDGELLIGSTGTNPVKATLTAGAGIVITNAAGSITIEASGGGTVSGDGTTDRLPKWTDGAGAVLGDSRIADDGADITIDSGVDSTTIGDVQGAGNSTSIIVDDLNTRILLTAGSEIDIGAADISIVSSTITLAGDDVLVSSLTEHRLMLIGASGLLTDAPALADGELLIGSTGADPVAGTLTAGSGIVITNAAGSITIESTGGATLTTQPFFPGKELFDGTTTTAVGWTNNVVYFLKFVLPVASDFSTITFEITGNLGLLAGELGVSVYDLAGTTKLIDTTYPFPQNNSVPGIIPAAVSVTLPAGVYILAFSTDNALVSPTMRVFANVTVAQHNLANAGGTQIGTAANASVAGVNPATLGALTPVAQAFPAIFLQ